MVWAEVVVEMTIRSTNTIFAPIPLEKSLLEGREGDKLMDRRLLGRQETRTGDR